jgi:hypothetical protein
MALKYRTGVLTGVGLSLLAAIVLPRWGRPAAKATIKGGMSAFETASETLARLRETLSDITAEAAYERTAEHSAASEAELEAAVQRDADRQETGEAQPVAAS